MLSSANTVAAKALQRQHEQQLQAQLLLLLLLLPPRILHNICWATNHASCYQHFLLQLV
jgi:hypothetical protein